MIVGLGSAQIVFRLANFARRCSALLLQPTERIEIALGQVERAVGFDELRVQREKFFLRATGCQDGLIGLRRLYLGLGTGGLRTNVGVVELQQDLALAHPVAFLNEQVFHRGRNGSVGLEILNGLDFTVRGDQAADGTALDGGGPYLQGSLVQIGIQHPGNDQERERQPNPPPA